MDFHINRKYQYKTKKCFSLFCYVGNLFKSIACLMCLNDDISILTVFFRNIIS